MTAAEQLTLADAATETRERTRTPAPALDADRQALLPGFAYEATGRRVRKRRKSTYSTKPLTWAGDDYTPKRKPHERRSALRDNHHTKKDSAKWHPRYIEGGPTPRPTEQLAIALVDAGIDAAQLFD